MRPTLTCGQKSNTRANRNCALQHQQFSTYMYTANDINSMKLFIIAHNCNNTTHPTIIAADSE